MLRTLLVGLLALWGISAAQAFAIFDGTFAFTAAANNCGNAGQSFTAIYRPQLAVSEPESAIVVGLYRSGIGFSRTTNGQFDGSGNFAGILLSSNALVADRIGAYDIVQTPVSIKASTQ